MVFIFLFLTFFISLSLIISRFIHVAANGIISFSLWLSNIPLQIADLLEKSLKLGKIEGRRRRGHQRMRWLDGITNAMDCNMLGYSVLHISRSLPKFLSIALVMPSSHLILWLPLFLVPSIFPSIRDFSSESAVRVRWPKYLTFSFNISPLMSIQCWFPLRLTCLISCCLRDFEESSPAPQFEGITSLVLCLLSGSAHNCTWPLQWP